MTALEHLPSGAIVRAVVDAAARWADADFPPRVRVLDGIAERTGYSIPVVEYALDALFSAITEAAVGATIAGELGSTGALDAFVKREGRPPARALPRGRVAIVSSRTTIGVALPAAVFALCAKNDVVVKDREDRLIAAFFRTLAEEHDAFSRAARAELWVGRGHQAADERDQLAAFDVVVAFGEDASLAEIRQQCGPGCVFVGFGSKCSAGYLARESLMTERSARAVAEAAARDIVLYETEGCLSLHLLFVERGGAIAPEDFLDLLAAAIERAHVEFPLGSRSPETIARTMTLRELATFRAASTERPPAIRYDARLSYLVILNPPRDEPPPFLPCAVPMFSVDAPEDARTYLASQSLPLEAIAIDTMRPDIQEFALAAGVSRIARFGSLQSPLLEAHHGGGARIGDFVRWVTDET